MSYEDILKEMQEALESFSKRSDQLTGYEYEEQFRALTDKYNQLLFQASLGALPRSKNGKQTITSSFGKVEVKKRASHEPSPVRV